jgi:hypothetical protein
MNPNCHVSSTFGCLAAVDINAAIDDDN